MDTDKDRIPSGPLFERLKDKGTASAFARALQISPQRLSNWRKRGVPAALLPQVAAAIGASAEEYLAAAGRPIARVEQPTAPYLTTEERQLIEDYRKATSGWRLTLRLLAKLPSQEQQEMSSSVNVLMAKITAEAVSDDRLGKNWTRPDRRK